MTADNLDSAVAAADAFSPTTPAGGASASCPYANQDVPRECRFLKKNGKELVQPKKGTFDKKRSPHLTSKPIDETYVYRGETKPRPSTTQMVTVRGRTIAVIRPSDDSLKGRPAPTNEQIANSLSALDDRQLDSIDNVVVNPTQNPDDAYWAQKDNDPDFHSQASAAPRTIDWYTFPSNEAPPSQTDVDSTIQHESGHEYSKRLSDKDHDDWKDAIVGDNEGPSKYGDTSDAEDFAEFSELYAMVKGTKCQSSLQTLYPNRYALMNDYMNRPITKPAPPAPAGPKMKLKPGTNPGAVNPFEDLEPDDGANDDADVPSTEDILKELKSRELMDPNVDDDTDAAR